MRPERRYFDRHHQVHPALLRSEGAAVQQDHSDSVMICLRPSQTTREVFDALPETTEPIDDLHLTLWYGGSIEDVGGEMARERIYHACYGVGMEWGNRFDLWGKANGFGWFMNTDMASLIALWDIPYLGEFRAVLMDQLEAHGVTLRQQNHGFTPHMTIANHDESNHLIPRVPADANREEQFDSLWLVWGEDWQEIPL